MCFSSHFTARTPVFLLKSVERTWAELIYATRLEFGYVVRRSDHTPLVMNERNFGFASF